MINEAAASNQAREAGVFRNQVEAGLRTSQRVILCPMANLQFDTALEFLKAVAATLIVVGALSEEDKELAESVSDVIAYLISIIDALEAQPEMDSVLLEQFVQACQSGIIDELRGGEE